MYVCMYVCGRDVCTVCMYVVVEVFVLNVCIYVCMYECMCVCMW